MVSLLVKYDVAAISSSAISSEDTNQLNSLSMKLAVVAPKRSAGVVTCPKKVHRAWAGPVLQNCWACRWHSSKQDCSSGSGWGPSTAESIQVLSHSAFSFSRHALVFGALWQPSLAPVYPLPARASFLSASLSSLR